jgi:uncharacterized membrane protein required for colicin V production
MVATIIVDVIISAILIAGMIIGIKFGFFLTAAKPVKWVAAIVIAFSTCGAFANAVVEPIIEQPITNQLSDYLADKCDSLTSENVEDELPTVLKLAAKIVDVDLDSFEGESGAEIIGQILEKLASPVVHFFALILSFIFLYFASKILLAIAVRILNKIFEHGILGVCNRIFGFVFCGSIAFVFSWIFVLIFSYFINIPLVADAAWANNFDGGILYDFLKRMSPLDILMSF